MPAPGRRVFFLACSSAFRSDLDSFLPEAISKSKWESLNREGNRGNLVSPFSHYIYNMMKTPKCTRLNRNSIFYVHNSGKSFVGSICILDFTHIRFIISYANSLQRNERHTVDTNKRQKIFYPLLKGKDGGRFFMYKLAQVLEPNGRVDDQAGDVTSFGVGFWTNFLLCIYHCGMTCKIKETMKT